MFLSLLLSVALADLPPPEPMPMPVIEKKVKKAKEEAPVAPATAEEPPGVTCSLRISAAEEGAVSSKKPVGVGLMCKNEGAEPAKHPINSETVRVFGTLKGHRIEIIPLWSLTEVDLQPGHLAAGFASVQFEPGEWLIEMFWDPTGGEPSIDAEPDTKLTLVVE